MTIGDTLLFSRGFSLHGGMKMGIEILKLEEMILKKELELLEKQLEIQKEKDQSSEDESEDDTGPNHKENADEHQKNNETSDKALHRAMHLPEKVLTAQRRAYNRAYNKSHNEKYNRDNSVKQKEYVDGVITMDEYIFWLDCYDKEYFGQGGFVAKGIRDSQTKVINKNDTKQKDKRTETENPVITYTFENTTLTLDEWAEKVGMSKGILNMRLSAGMPFEEAITTPY